MEAILSLGVVILGAGVATLTIFNDQAEQRIKRLEDIHTWGKWHDE